MLLLTREPCQEPDPVVKSTQEDAHEFLRMLLEAAERDILWGLRGPKPLSGGLVSMPLLSARPPPCNAVQPVGYQGLILGSKSGSSVRPSTKNGLRAGICPLLSHLTVCWCSL